MEVAKKKRKGAWTTRTRQNSFLSSPPWTTTSHNKGPNCDSFVTFVHLCSLNNDRHTVMEVSLLCEATLLKRQLNATYLI
jgi:hypothetical protein